MIFELSRQKETISTMKASSTEEIQILRRKVDEL